MQLAAPLKTVRLVLPGVSWEAGLEGDKNVVSGSILTLGLWRGVVRRGRAASGRGRSWAPMHGVSARAMVLRWSHTGVRVGVRGPVTGGGLLWEGGMALGTC